jgi:hypothetical protein
MLWGVLLRPHKPGRLRRRNLTQPGFCDEIYPLPLHVKCEDAGHISDFIATGQQVYTCGMLANLKAYRSSPYRWGRDNQQANKNCQNPRQARKANIRTHN